MRKVNGNFQGFHRRPRGTFRSFPHWQHWGSLLSFHEDRAEVFSFQVHPLTDHPLWLRYAGGGCSVWVLTLKNTNTKKDWKDLWEWISTGKEKGRKKCDEGDLVHEKRLRQKAKGLRAEGSHYSIRHHRLEVWRPRSPLHHPAWAAWLRSRQRRRQWLPQASFA